MNKKILLILFAVFSLALSSCTKNSRPLAELIEDNSEAQYLVQSGDTLSVNVWGEPKVSGEVFVREDGSFTMALIEDVKAVGLTPKQIAQSITTRLKKFIPSASVSVSVAQSSPIRYYLSGQFNKPGEYRSDKRISLLQAIATGGSFAPFADESDITLIRRATSGEEMRYILDYNRIMDGKQPNPDLKNGDFISVK